MARALHTLAYPAIGALIGYIAWGISPHLIPVSLLLFVGYGASEKRLHAFLLMLAYFLCGTRGMIEGTINYYGGAPLLAIGFWLAASIGFVGVYTVLWSDNAKRRTWGFLIALFLLAVPPLGIIGYISPITSAGILYPNAGFIGLGLTIIVMVVSVYFPLKRAIKIAAPFCFIALILNLTNSHELPMDNWEAVTTHTAFVPNSDNFEAHLNMEVLADKLIRNSAATNIVFPESSLKMLTPDTGFIWSLYARSNDKTIYAGGQKEIDGKFYNTVIRFAPKSDPEVVYRQRMPVPFSMWRPWRTESIEATFFDTPVFDTGQQRIGFLICYEQLLVWPYIQSRLAGADSYVGIANHWWFADTTVPRIEEHSLIAWSRLFGLNLESSINI